MIIRAKKKDNFTIVYNEFIRDKRLSARAKGVMIWLLSKPDDWSVRRDNLHKEFTEGRDAIWNAFKELIDSGYVAKEIQQTGGIGIPNAKHPSYTVYEVSVKSESFRDLYRSDS